MQFSRFRRVLAAGLALALVLNLGIGVLSGDGSGSGWSSLFRGGTALAADTFTFAHITDPHVGSSQGNTNTPRVVEQLLSGTTRPAFVINGGDITEFGRPYQYDAYQNMIKPLADAGISVFHTSGNHDSRWTDAGKDDFTRRFGKPYSSFDRGGVHFVLLDTSIGAETHGHLDKYMLDWLAADLARVGTTTPVMVFTHHPLGYTASRFVDNDQDLLDIVRPYNVVAFFGGHGHLNLQWNVNGIPAFMTAAAMDAGFKLVEVSGNEARIYNQVAGGEPQLAATLSLTKPTNRASVRITSPRSGQVIDSPTAQKLSIQYEAIGFPTEPTTPPAPTDGSQSTSAAEPAAPSLPTPPGPMVKVRVRLGVGAWQDYTGSIDLTNLPPGYHDLYLEAHDANGNRYVDRVQVRLTRFLRRSADPGAPQNDSPLFATIPALRWQFQTNGAIQGQPVSDGTRVYAGSTDGRLYAVRADYGQLAWSYQTGGAILAGPTLDNGKLYFGSADGKVYALEAATGRLLWAQATGGAVVAPPLVRDGAVYIGSSDRNLYALSAADGGERWRASVGDTIRTRPTYGRGAIYVGDWDRTVYAVDAKTGKVRWSRVIARDIYYSSSNGSPAYGMGRLFLTTPNDTKAGSLGLWALDPADGATLWQNTESTGFASPQLKPGSLLVGTLNGTSILYDPLTGAEQGRVSSGWSTYDSSPVYFGGGGDVVQGSLGGRLVAANPLTGKVLWTYALGDNLIFAQPGVYGSTVYVGSMDGTLTAVAATPSPALPALTFKDLPNHWAKSDVEFLAAAGLTNGLPDGSYGAELPLRRGELATLVARFLGLAKPSDGFQSQLGDLTDHWAKPYVEALEEKGLLVDFVGVGAPTNGTGTGATGGAADGTGTLPVSLLVNFRPQDPATRGEAALLIAAVLRLKVPEPGFESQLTDLGSYPYRAAVEVLEEQGLVTGYQVGGKIVYNPSGNLTRAQAAALMARMLRY